MRSSGNIVAIAAAPLVDTSVGIGVFSTAQATRLPPSPLCTTSAQRFHAQKMVKKLTANCAANIFNNPWALLEEVSGHSQ